MALPATDSFNRADANPIGGNWTTAPGANACQIVTNRCQGTTAGASNSVYWNADSFNSNHYSQCTCGSTGGLGPTVRIQTGAGALNGYYLRRHSGTVIRIMKITDGTITQVGTDITSTTGTSSVLKISASGSTLSYYLDGVFVDSREDATHTGGAAGVFLGTTSIPVDNWEGGDVAAGGGSAYPYTGGVGDGAITQSAATQRIRGIVRELGGAQAYSAGTVKARGKVPVVGGDFSFNAATVKARGRVPTVGGAAAFSTGSIYSKATLYLYAGGASQVYSAESVKARGKSPIVGGSIIYAAASEYSKFSAPGTNYAYVGDGVLVFGNGSEHAIGRVYESGGAFHFSAGSVYVKTAGSNAYSYTGLATGAIVYTGATVIIYTRNRVHEDKPGVRTTTSESVPQSTTGQTEAKPGARAASHEALPTRPPGQDGFYADPAQDGFYDEYPAQGFYADIGYFKEFKPFHRATFTKEGKPS